MSVESCITHHICDCLAAELLRLRAEVAYLRARAKQAGYCPLGSERDVGRSANAMLEYALGGTEPTEEQYPLDGDDLAACVRARDHAPEHLQARMDRILELYRRHLERGRIG